MVDNIKKYIIRTELDTKGVVKQYDDMMRKLAQIDKKYGKGKSSGSGVNKTSLRGGSSLSEDRVREANWKRAEAARVKAERAKDAEWRKAETARTKAHEEESARERRLNSLRSKYAAEEEARKKRYEAAADIRDKAREREAKARARVKPTPRTFRDTQRFHNMNAGMGDLLGQLSAMPRAGIHKDLQGQIEIVQSRIADLRNQLSRVSSGRELANLTIKYREARAEAMALLKTNQKYNNSLGITNQLSNKFVSSLKHAGLAAASIYGIARLGGIVFSIGKDMDAMRASLLAASKDAAEAPENFEFLRKTSFELGKDIQTMTGGFNRLGVAARAAGFETSEIKEIFLAASEASTTFALDNQRTGLVMLAMSQIMSKGKVSLEEISRQLGENLPIAVEAGARSMGLAQGEFMKLVASGKVSSKEFALPFARQLRMMVRENDALAKATTKLTARQQRLVSVFKDLMDQTFQNGVAESIGRLFDLLTKFTVFVTPVAKSLMIGIGEIVEMLGEATYAVGEFLRQFFNLAGAGDYLSRAWSAQKAFWHTLAAAVWEVIGAVQYLSELMSGKRDLNLGAFKDLSGTAFGNTPMGLLWNAGASALSGNKAGNNITVQGDVKVVHDGTASFTDNFLTELGF